MLRIISALLIISNFTTVIANTKQFFIKPTPNWVKEINYDKNFHLYNDNKEDGGTYVLIDYQLDVAKQEYYTHVVIRIDEEAGIQNYSDIWINFDPSFQQLIFHKLSIYRNNREINRLNKSDFKVIQNETDLKRKIYSGNYSAGLFIEDVQVGDILEYSYTKKGENPILNGNFFATYNFEFSVPINKLFLQVSYPKERNINYKLIKAHHSPKKTEKNNRISLTWELNDIGEIVLNSGSPSWYIAFGKVQFSEFSTWSQVINWGKQLYPNINITNTSLEQKLNQLTGKLESKDEKIDKIIRFIQEEINYVGIEVNENSYKPRSPLEVYNKRFGDCKEKSYLMVTMLEHIGVEAWPAYINSALEHNINQYLPSPVIFDHVIVAISDKNNLYFIDPTLSNQRGSFKKRYNGNYKTALVLNENYTKPVSTPNYSHEKIVIHEKIEVFDTVKPVKYSIVSTYYGGEADIMRSNFKEQTTKELESNYLNFYAYIYPAMRFTQELKFEDNENDNIVTISEFYEIDNFWSFDDTPDINDYVAELYASNIDYYVTNPEQRNRTVPYGLYHPIEIENRIEFVHANDIEIDNESGEINNPGFNFTYDVKCKDKTVIFEYKYKSLKDNISVEELNKYYNDIDEINEIIWNEYTYGGGDIHDDDGRLNWLMIIMTLFFSLILIYLATKLYRKDIESLVKPDSIPIGGWLILPVIGVALSPIILTYSFFSSGYFSLSAWEFISSVNSEGYDALWTATFLLELFMNSLLLIYSVFIVIILIQRRTIFPSHFIAFQLINLVLIVTDTILVSNISSEYFTYEQENSKEIAQAVISSAIWIPYMHLSQRVKKTFTKKYKIEL